MIECSEEWIDRQAIKLTLIYYSRSTSNKTVKSIKNRSMNDLSSPLLPRTSILAAVKEQLGHYRTNDVMMLWMLERAFSRIGFWHVLWFIVQFISIQNKLQMPWNWKRGFGMVHRQVRNVWSKSLAESFLLKFRNSVKKRWHIRWFSHQELPGCVPDPGSSQSSQPVLIFPREKTECGTSTVCRVMV